MDKVILFLVKSISDMRHLDFLNILSVLVLNKIFHLLL